MAQSGLLRYQDYVSLIRRFDRDLLLYGMSQCCLGWDGHPFDEDGVPKAELPWNFAGAAAVVLTRGTAGGRHPSKADVLALAHEFSRIETPQRLDDAPDTFGLLLRWAYEQWPYNRQSKRDWARCVALFVDTPFESGYQPEALVPGWEDELLGVSVEDFVSVGVLLFASANQGGRYPFPWSPEMEDVREALGGQERIDEIFLQNFATTIDDFKRARRQALQIGGESEGRQFLREPFSFNPLLSTPFVGGVLPNAWLAPCPPALNLKISPVGVAYAGIAKWGERFHHDLGHLFEQYIGRQLRQHDRFDVTPEVTFGKEEKKTIDWFVVTQEAILLVECKSVMPNQSIREGLAEHSGAHDRALSKGVKQLNRTFAQYQEGSPVLSFLPRDRPVVGLLVTMGSFDLADQGFVQAALPAAALPTAVVNAEFIERLVSMSDESVASILRSALDFDNGRGFVNVSAWQEGQRYGDNPVLQAAYNRLPIVGMAKERGVDTD